MTRIAMASLLICLLSLGAGDPTTPTPSASTACGHSAVESPTACKGSGAVSVDGVTAEGHARVEIAFPHGASQAEVRLWGTGGAVCERAPVQRAFAAGETLTLDLLLSGTAGKLAVSVDATVGGQTERVVRTFSVPGPAARARAVHVEIDAQGDRVRVSTVGGAQ